MVIRGIHSLRIPTLLPVGELRIGLEAMPVFFFSIRHGKYSDVSHDGVELPDHSAAWKEMTGVCRDMIGDVSRQLVENAEWQMELLDERRKPVFRIRLIAETLD